MPPSPTPPSTVLDTLRRATAELHRQTEQALDLPRSCSSKAEYRALLERMLGFYEPLEEKLLDGALPTMREGVDWQARRKAPVLRADLALLGSTGIHVARCAFIPAMDSDAARIGAWYVVEGATLGGRVIAQYLAKQLGIEARTGGGFFDSYGEQREQRWEEFCSFLATLPARDADAVAAGAVAVFDAMRRWLQDRPAAR